MSMKHVREGINYYKTAIGSIYVYSGRPINKRRVIKRYFCITDVHTSAPAWAVGAVAPYVEIRVGIIGSKINRRNAGLRKIDNHIVVCSRHSLNRSLAGRRVNLYPAKRIVPA